MEMWKYQLKVAYHQTIPMPAEAAILSLQVLDGKPTIWALVDPTALRVNRVFVILGTGQPITNGHARHYVGTYQLGTFVGHVFEEVA